MSGNTLYNSELCKDCISDPSGICPKHEVEFKKDRLRTAPRPKHNIPGMAAPIVAHEPKKPMSWDGVPKCNKCGLNGPTPVRVEQLCETCFTEVYIAPISKELKRATDLVTQLSSAQFAQMQRLRDEQRITLSGPPKKYSCKRCNNYTTDSMGKLLWHDANFCEGPKNPEKKVSVSRPRRSAVAVDIGDDEVE